MVVLGCRGIAEVVNGVYAQHFITHDGRPTFSRAGTGRALYMFFHARNKAWAIADSIGSTAVAAFCPDAAALPCLVRARWRAAAADGKLVEDRRIACS